MNDERMKTAIGDLLTALSDWLDEGDNLPRPDSLMPGSETETFRAAIRRAYAEHFGHDSTCRFCGASKKQSDSCPCGCPDDQQRDSEEMLAKAVIERLGLLGIKASYEYPGFILIDVSDPMEVA